MLMGRSFGGIVAQAYPLAHPDDLDGLVICTSGPTVSAFYERWQIAARHGTPEQLELMRSGPLRQMERAWSPNGCGAS